MKYVGGKGLRTAPGDVFGDTAIIQFRAPAPPAQTDTGGRHRGARPRRATRVGRGAKPPSEDLRAVAS
jgi:hypothetical protein